MPKLSPLARSLVLAALLGGMAWQPAFAAGTTGKSTDTKPTTVTTQSKSARPMMSPEERIEKRITDLHDRLKITEAQASGWNSVAKVMRENDRTIHDMVKERHEQSGQQTAIDDLQSYQKIAAAHADGMSKFIQAFQPLYDSMSDEQKKNADTVFASYEGRMGGRRHGGMTQGKPQQGSPQ